MVCLPSPRYRRRLTVLEPFHPADEHLGIAAVDVHPRAVDVEVPQADVVRAVHVVVGAEQPFAERLGRPVQGAVVVRVVLLARREHLGHAIDGSRGRHDDLADVRFLALLDEIERRLDHHVECRARLGRTVGDAQRGLVKDRIAARNDVGEQLRIADVAYDDADFRARCEGTLEILRPAAHHVVDDNDLRTAGFDQEIDDVRADETGAAGNQDALALEQICRAERDRSASLLLPLLRLRLQWHLRLLVPVVRVSD